MTITFTKAYVTNGKTYATLEEAKKWALHELICLSDGTYSVQLTEHIIAHADEVIDILTTTATSKPSARRINGGTKKRKPKTTEQPQLPNTEAA